MVSWCSYTTVRVSTYWCPFRRISRNRKQQMVCFPYAQCSPIVNTALKIARRMFCGWRCDAWFTKRVLLINPIKINRINFIVPSPLTWRTHDCRDMAYIRWSLLVTISCGSYAWSHWPYPLWRCSLSNPRFLSWAALDKSQKQTTWTTELSFFLFNAVLDSSR